MALGLITVSNAAFTDAASIEKTEAVDVLSAIGVIGGYPDGSFKPEGEVTRAEMAKMVAVIMNKGEDVGDLYKNACKFADSANHWAAGYIAYCAQEGIISGKSETKFDPDGKVTGTEAAKMLLCALGYDADAEGFKGATWASAVLSKAAKIGLVGTDANLTVDMGAALNRDNTAQMMLNALQSDMVEYESTSTITVSGVTINNNSKASAVTKKGAQYSKIANDAVAADTYVVQLGEEMFKDLEKVGAGNDAFGRATSNWTFEGKVVTEAPAVATMVLKDKVTGGELYTALGKIDLYATDAAAWTTRYFVDGEAKTFPTNIKSGEYGEIGQIGDVIEIYKDSSAKTLDIIQINYHVAQIAQVWAAKVDANGDETDPAYVQLKGINGNLSYGIAELSNGKNAAAANTFETAAFTAADKDAFVVYTAGNDNLIASVAKAESVTGLFSSKSKESVTIGGTKYATVTGAVDAALAMNAEATAYLDPNGNAIYVEGVASNDYAYLIDAQEVGGVNKTMEGILVFTDGTRKVVTLDTSVTFEKGAAYAYTVNADGSYKLSGPVGTEIATLAKYDANTVNVADGIKANANTVFVVETYDSAAKAAVYATYTGIANVPNITSTKYTAGWTTYTAQQAGDAVVGLTKPGDVYATVVYVFGAVTQSSSKEVTALYLTGLEDVTDDGNGAYYTVKAIVNGAETTVKVAEGATGITLPASAASLVITNNMTVDTNGYITSVGALAETELNAAYKDFAKDAYGVYTGTYANGVIELVTSKGATAGDAISVAETLPVYAYNTTTRTFQITTIGSYVPANNIETLLVKLDTTVNPSVAAALYIIENNSSAT
ncbi:MAG: S-layer homology domain-containing protein [Oscillospiraceae bacterium]|nr:S-layer homology domain-containing protein [Oscillospiraceae bacterium]